MTSRQLTFDDNATAPAAECASSLREAWLACEHYQIDHASHKHLLRKIDGDRHHIHPAAELVMEDMLYDDHDEDLLNHDHLFCQLARIGAVMVLEEIDTEAHTR